MRRRTRPLALPFAVLSALSLLGAALLAPLAVDAQGRLRADIFFTQQKVPKAGTERALIGFARRANSKVLREATDAPVEKRVWYAQMIVAFNRPPGDLQYQVLYYDTTDGGRKFVDDSTVFISDRSQKTFVQKVKLDRPRFQPNRHMELVVTVRRQEVGSRKFDLAGEAIRRTGVVNISDEEAQKAP